MAMICMQAWKLITNPNAPMPRLLKAKYFPQGDYFSVGISHNPNYVWCEIYSLKDVLRRGFKWSIGSSESILVRHHPWLSGGDYILSVSHRQLAWPDITVSELLAPNVKHLNLGLINIIFLLRHNQQSPQDNVV